MQKKKKPYFICLCLCIGLTACSTTDTEGRSRSALPETEQTVPQEDALAESTEETVSQGDESIELFNSQGVYIQILAEGDEDLSEEDRAEFLAAFGFEDSEPFYVHTEEDGYPFMKLYYDEEREIGCGIRYGENVSGNVICGFAFDHCLEVSWHKRDPFSVLSVYGTTGESGVTDYQENYEYDEEGRLLSFQSTGTPTDIDGEEWKNMRLITVNFSYDDQGRLREKEYWHSTSPHAHFSTTYASQSSYYDERGRLAHTGSYVTHGSLEGYYIYQGNDDAPAYYLELDHQYTSWPTLYRFVNRNDNWEFGGFRRSTEAQDQTYEIEPGGEEDFLLKQGFTEEDLYYEYEYKYAWDTGTVFRLSLYCDEYVTRGTGLIRQYRDGEYVDLEIFSFDGCEQYLDDAAVGQYSVYSHYYFSGREVHFLEGETIDDYFGALDRDDVSFDYEDGKLVHMYERRPHGGVDRFYFYKAYDQSYRCGPCLLEVDHGWGVTFYRF